MRSLGKRISPVQLRVRAPSSWPFPTVAMRNHRSRASAQVGFIIPHCPGQHRRLRPSLPPCSSLRISFVKKPCRCNPGWRPHSICSRSPISRGTTLRASPVQVRGLPRAPLGGEIGSWLSYKQQSEGQNLPGRPFSTKNKHLKDLCKTKQQFSF